MRFPDDYIVIAILFGIMYLGYFLLKKENPILFLMGVIITVCLITLALILWAVADNTQINELIKQGYLPADYTTEDIFKLCNPQTDSEREALEGAPNHAMTCYTRGGD